MSSIRPRNIGTHGRTHVVYRDGHTLADPSWEVYGDGTDNSAELRPDVFSLLQECGHLLTGLIMRQMRRG